MKQLSDYMIEWMDACTDYHEREMELMEEGGYDLDYYLHNEKEHMLACGRRYLLELKECLDALGEADHD